MYVDYFGNDTSALKSKRLFLLDMDGTIYNEERLFEGTLDLLEEIKRIGGRYIFVTNNSSKSVLDYVAKAKRLKIKADKNNFFTSTQAAALLLKKQYPGAKVYCQGTKSFVRELQMSGINVTEEVEDDVEIVLVGFDTELTGEKLRKTCELLGRKVLYYATNPDLRCPVNFGYIPDCGSICRMLFHCTGKTPIYIGKPEPIMVETLCQKFRMRKEEAVMIGDRLYTDIAAGFNARINTICVLTGEATIEDIECGTMKPTFIFYSVKEIYEAIHNPF